MGKNILVNSVYEIRYISQVLRVSQNARSADGMRSPSLLRSVALRTHSHTIRRNMAKTQAHAQTTSIQFIGICPPYTSINFQFNQRKNKLTLYL